MKNNSLVRIIIKDMIVNVRIGLYDHEKENGRSQRIIVNVELFADAQGYLDNPTRDTIIDYDDVYGEIKKWANNGHTELIETYLKGLLGVCFKNEKVQEARVSIAKPDIFEEAERVGVEVHMTRQEFKDSYA